MLNLGSNVLTRCTLLGPMLDASLNPTDAPKPLSEKPFGQVCKRFVHTGCTVLSPYHVFFIKLRFIVEASELCTCPDQGPASQAEKILRAILL